MQYATPPENSEEKMIDDEKTDRWKKREQKSLKNTK